MSDYLKTPLWNNQLSLDERLDYLVKELTIEEKLECLTTSCPEVPRLGVRPYWLGGEAAHGVEARNDQAFSRGEPHHTTSFTQPVGMSGSFDKDLIKECGRVIGDEARGLHGKANTRGLSRWAPTIDMARDPRWGRTEEAYGEDPYLAGEMASGLIQGMRGDDPFYIKCAATLKHFYANNVEKDRSSASSSIDNRNKHEYYLEPFRKAIVEGGAEGIMAAYNEINGVPALLNDEIQKIAKDKWGLSGHVVSDATDLQQTVTAHKFFETYAESLAAALKAGVDNFPDDRDLVLSAGREALEKGLITEADIDKSIRNSFGTRIRLGLYDNDCPYNRISEDCINSKEHQEIGLKMAKASVVLLKNDNNMLPIKTKVTDEMLPPKIAVIGPLADVWNKDWYCPMPPYTVNPLEGIKAEYPESEITFCSGRDEVKIICGGRFIGLDENARLFMTSSDQAELFIVNDWGSGSVTLQAKNSGYYVTIDDETGIISATKEVLFDWFLREVWQFEDIIETSTSRKLSRSSGMVNYHFKSWNGKQVVVDENNYLAVTDEKDEAAAQLVFSRITVLDGVKEAVNLAFGADYAFVIAGTNPIINSKENHDRTTLALPPHQQLIAERVGSVNPHTVLVLVSNYPHTLSKKLNDSISAILFTASGSQDLGHAIAQTISGRSVPSGRLSMTWYADEIHLPDINDYDIIKGNRTYQYFDKEVLYPFGHGLSYSRFTYNNFTAALNEAEQKVDINMMIRNRGYYQADEVVQIYVRKENSRAKQPLKQLKAFRKEKDFMPGESREISFSIPLAELHYFDVISEKMILEAGEYIFRVGASSKDIRGQMSVEIPGETLATRLPEQYTKAVNYDDYRHIQLCRGEKNEDGGYSTCVAPLAAVKSAGRYSSCKIIYNDFIFTKIPHFIRVDVHPQEVCKIVVYNNMTMIATEDFNGKEGFISKEIMVNADKVILNENVSVQIQIYGSMKILGFVFA